jgi:protein gp37
MCSFLSLDNFTLPNVGLGTTVENSYEVDRIGWLLKSPAAMRFISYEPALGPVSDWEDHLDGVDWLIAGGESGPGARPCHPDWIRSAHAACMMTDTAFFFKHWGGVNKKKAGRLLDRVEYSERPDFLKGTA